MRTWAETLSLRADGYSLVITGAPPLHGRYERGIREVLRRSRVSKDLALSWREFAEYALSIGVIIDPLLDQPPEEGVDRRYAGPGTEIVTGQQAGGRR